MPRNSRPKRSIRQRPKVTLPIRLDDLCLNVITGMLARAAHKTALNRDPKESVKEHLSNLPSFVPQNILRHAAEKFSKAEVILFMLEMFEPCEAVTERVDFLGPLRMRFGCLNPNRPNWLVISLKDFMLTVAQLDQLHKILSSSKPSGLKEICMSTSRDSLKASSIPNILAKGRSLTKLTLLSGADNHTLRILGTSCPCLTYLDVSNSRHVTDQGLWNLLLERPSRRGNNTADLGDDGETRSLFDAALTPQNYGEPRPQEKNPCVETLTSITLLGTSVTLDGCDYICKLMNNAYLYACLPVIKILRIADPRGIFHKMTIRSQTSVTPGLDIIDQPAAVTDVFATPDGGRALSFLRKNNSFRIYLHMKMESNIVTSLVLPWFSTWEGELFRIISLDILGVSFPNLKYFKGRILGIWNRLDKTFMPNLEVVCLWSSNSTTALSMLQHAPVIKLFEFNDSQIEAIQDKSMELTDASVEACFTSNDRLAESLEEIIIRPSKLTHSSLRFLVRSCPNLKKIGDLQSWKINDIEIGRFNKHLDKIRSQCVLSIMNFPPPSTEKIEWI